jgi:hypothetical protein
MSLIVMSPTSFRLDDEELLDAVLVEELLGVVVRDAGGTVTSFLRHQRARRAGRGSSRSGCRAPSGSRRAIPFHHRDAADVVLAHDLERVAERLGGPHRDGSRRPSRSRRA